jgi:hypothetical protein
MTMLLLLFALAASLWPAPFPRPPDLRTAQSQDLTPKEIVDLRNERDLADTFMHQALTLAAKKLEKAPGKDGDKKLQADRKLLEKLLAHKHFFDYGTAPAELSIFHSQVAKAGKLDIKLTDQAVKELIKVAVLRQLNDKDIQRVAEEVGKAHGGVPADAVFRALSDEFRARIIREMALKKR